QRTGPPVAGTGAGATTRPRAWPPRPRRTSPGWTARPARRSGACTPAPRPGRCPGTVPSAGWPAARTTPRARYPARTARTRAAPGRSPAWPPPRSRTLFGAGGAADRSERQRDGELPGAVAGDLHDQVEPAAEREQVPGRVGGRALAG